MYLKKIEDIASKMLLDLGINKLPIPINEIVERRGLRVVPYDFEDVSGVLVVEKGIGTIGINPNESAVRQRFTIAHELGHYELHRQKGDLFIDKAFKVYFRDHNSSTGEHIKEMEANSFAAAILMPRNLVIKEIEKNHLDFSESEGIKQLAEIFEVSQMAMTIRISNLNLF